MYFGEYFSWYVNYNLYHDISQGPKGTKDFGHRPLTTSLRHSLRVFIKILDLENSWQLKIILLQNNKTPKNRSRRFLDFLKSEISLIFFPWLSCIKEHFNQFEIER